MWQDYSRNHNVSYELYQKVFQSENIGFGTPSQDECDICAKFKAHKLNEEQNTEHEKETCDECTASQAHLDRAGVARRKYQADKSGPLPENCVIFAVDMQKVILLPKLTTKEHFFTSRLVVFNETFARLDGKQDLVILWHEAIAGRLAQNVASSYIKCIAACEKENIIFWADNCCAQNKN